MLLAALAAIGAFLFRLRGGLWVFPKGRLFHALGFGLALGCITFNPYQGFAGAAAMGLWQGAGWGRYIGALAGTEDKPLEEKWWVDWAIKRLRPHMRWWGFAGLTLRGTFLAPVLVKATMSWWPLLAGLLMAIVYYLAIEWSRWRHKQPGWGWPLGEWWFGAVLWVLCLAPA